MQIMGQSHRNTITGKYVTLDGLRGVAAILVVGRHAGPLGYTTPESFLAVDLFFCLSGFVIAAVYDGRLAGGGFVGRFALARMIRIYPLYLLGLLLGIVASATGGFPIGQSAVLAGLLMIPLNPWMAGSVGSFNTPVWTLPLELFANMAYALAHRFLALPVLLVVVAVSGLGLIWSARVYGQVDLGWALDQWPVGLSRLFFSFTAGVLLARVARGRRARRPLMAWICVALAEALLIYHPAESFRLTYDLAAILVGFPLVVLIGSQSEPSPGAGAVFEFGGQTSYAVYVLHAPLAALVLYASARLGLPWTPGLPGILAFMLALVAVAWLANRFADLPVRGWLAGHLLTRRSRAMPAPPCDASGAGPVRDRVQPA